MTDVDSAPSAAERAYRAVRDAIIEGRHAPGEMLGEAALAESLGMSRTPVRVALARLQDEGWIVVYPKRGALVQGLSDGTIAELSDARHLLETNAVATADPDAQSLLAAELDELIDGQRDAVDAEDLTAFIDLSVRFHRGFVEAGGNQVLLELYDRLADRQRFALFAAGERLRSRCAEIIQEHEQLLRLLREGDALRFSATLHHHIEEVLPAPRDRARPIPASTEPREVVYRRVDTPIGPLLVASTQRGLVRVAFEREDFDAVLADIAERLKVPVVEAPDRLGRPAAELGEYFAGTRRRFDLPLDFALSAGFRRRVQEELLRIRYGRTRSYKEVAERVGNPNAVRAVGTACATNPLPVVVPCHRVLRSDGALGGYLGGLDAKRSLLAMEGAG